MLIALLSFSQENYPRRIELKGDTLCLITIPQVRKINERLLERRYFRSLSDSLLLYQNYLRDQLQIQNHHINELLSLDSISRERQREILSRYNSLFQEKETLSERNKRKRKWIWIGTGIGLITGFILGK